MTLRTVVLPAPFGPITLVMRPGSPTKLTFEAALIPPNDMLMPRTTSAYGAAWLARNLERSDASAVAPAGLILRRYRISVPMMPSGAIHSTTSSNTPTNSSRYSARPDSNSGIITVTMAPTSGPSPQPAPPTMTASRNRIDCENGNESGATNIMSGAKMAPASPANIADIAKAAVLIVIGLSPTERAAASLSRTARIALPQPLAASRWNE